MLSLEVVESLLKPISESLPSGEDLEYNPAFMSLEADSQPKAEQQFGETVIPAVEPDWRDLLSRSVELLNQTKDIRVAVLCLRAATRSQGIIGLQLGLSLLTQMIDRFWDTLNPKLDPEDNNDPTMRLNVLAALTESDSGVLPALRDVYDCLLGTPRSIGPIKIRDIAIALGKLTAGVNDPNYTIAAIHDGLRDIQSNNPTALQSGLDAAEWADKLQRLLNEKAPTEPIDLKPLRQLLLQVRQSCQEATGADSQVDASGDAGSEDGSGRAPSAAGPIRGEIRTREEAIAMLDKVIQFIERTEPGNPAPLLIARAKKLVGINFLSIIEELAPDAMSAIQNITGRPPGS
jgi:type VI secretion system protein ImpA